MPETAGGAFVGYPHLSAQARIARALSTRGLGQHDTVPDQLLSGFFGDSSFDKPVSVFDPKAKQKNTARDVGYLTNLASQILPPVVAAGRQMLKAPPKLAGGKASQLGAIRVGGREDLVTAHGMSGDADALEKITKEGLHAPSFALVKKGNPFQPTVNIVHRAGALDRPFPSEAPSGFFNRDAYTGNPDKFSGRHIADQWDETFRRREVIPGSAKMTEGLFNSIPDAQIAAIHASPSFRSMEHYEKSPFGAALLGESSDVRKYKQLFNERLAAHTGAPDGIGKQRLLQELEAFRASGRDPALHQGELIPDLYRMARQAPSEYGELKIYAPNVPANPGVASIFQADAGPNNFFTANAKKLGWDVYGPKELAGMAGDLSLLDKPAREMPLHLLAPSSGKAPMSPKEALGRYRDLIGGYAPDASLFNREAIRNFKPDPGNLVDTLQKKFGLPPLVAKEWAAEWAKTPNVPLGNFLEKMIFPPSQP